MQLRRNPHFPQDHFTNNKTAGLLSDSLSNPSPPRHGPGGPTWSVPLQIGCSLTQTQTQEEMKLSLSNFHNAGDELNVPVSARAGRSDVVGAFANTNTEVPAQSLLLRLTWCRHRRRCRGKQGVNRRHRHTLRDPPQSFLLLLLLSSCRLGAINKKTLNILRYYIYSQRLLSPIITLQGHRRRP